MKDRILKWWNREWSDWGFFSTYVIYENSGNKYPLCKYRVYMSKSNDGLEKFKKIKI